jgi:predicted transglutaminase-like cysteine proteinase
MIRSKTFKALLFGFSIALFPSFTSQAVANSVEKVRVQQVGISNLHQWQRVMEDYVFEGSLAPSSQILAWKNFIGSIRNDTPSEQIQKINTWFNGFPYKEDIDLYGENDHWSTPSEFLVNGGDCEDFAIIKYLTLRELGFPSKDLRIAIVYDVKNGTDHSLLFVNHEGKDFVLDNREAVTDFAYYNQRYKPHYIFNENALWTFNHVLAKIQNKFKNNGEIIPADR